MRNIALALLLAVLALSATAQTETPQQWAGAGITYNQFATPQINGLAVYARRLADSTPRTYLFNSINVLNAYFEDVTVNGKSTRVFRLITMAETGIAQHVLEFGRFNVYALGQLGVAAGSNASGTDVGMALTGGGIALASVGKGWSLGPVLRVTRTGVGERQWSAGLLLGWGK